MDEMSEVRSHSDASGYDLESFAINDKDGEVVVTGYEDVGSTKRLLEARHLQFIALGGTLGTGLFVGVASVYATGGPLALLLGYSLIGTAVYCVMIALGEMTSLLPINGAFQHYAGRFVDPALAYATGWMYWFIYAITFPAEATAFALLMKWWPNAAVVNPAVYISIMIVTALGINLAGVRYYGEAEMYFAILKVVTIISLIVMTFFVTAGVSPSGRVIGFEYWKNPGPFQQFEGIAGPTGRFLAFWAVLIQAAFAYIGTEVVALAAAESVSPRKNVPKAIRRIFWRILLFYVLGVFCIGLLVSPANPMLTDGFGARASPWVIGIEQAGIKALPAIVNGVIISSAFSAGNAHLYASSRSLYSLATESKAPRIFRYCTRRGVPIVAVCTSASFGLLAFMNLSDSGGQVFTWLSSLSAVSGVLVWLSILVTFLRFHAAATCQGYDRNEFPFKARFQPYASYFAIAVLTLVVLFNGFRNFIPGKWSTSDFFVSYLPVLVFVLLFLGWKKVKRTHVIPLEIVDFDTGRREIDMQEEAVAAASARKKATFWRRTLQAVL